MKLSLVSLPAALLCLAAATQIAPARGFFVVKPSGVAPPVDIIGEHQPLEKSWTIYSTSALTSLTFQGSGTVFVEFDSTLKTDPAPVIPEVPSPPSPQGPPPPHDRGHPERPAGPPGRHFEPPAPPSPPREPHGPLLELIVIEGSTDGSLSDDLPEPFPVVPVAQLQAIAKIVVSGDSEDLLESFHIETSSNSDADGLEIVVDSGSTKKGGYALTQLFVVKKSALTNIKAISSGDVVIGENVLVTNSSTANVTLSSVGSGDIFLTSNESMSVGALEIFTAGSGDVQLELASVSVARAITLSGVASGDIALLADHVEAESIGNMIVGSADLFVQANSVNVTKLDTFLGGSGSATLSKSGECVNQTVMIAGSGKVKTGSIACENVDVSIFGSGDALVQAKSKLSVTLVASGSVEYVNATPHQVVIKGSVFRKRLDRRVSHVDENKFHVYKRERAPSRTPKYVHAKKKHHGFWWGIFGDDSDDDDDSSDRKDASDKHHHFKIVINDGSVGEDVEINGDFGDDEDSTNGPQVVSLAASTGAAPRAPSAASIVGVFGVVMGVVGVAAFKYKQRRARNQYTPLF
ncbi:hypothetical protein Gpo141_00012515 [Globisporangium polare]